jgi:hypothetical protein
MTKTAPQRRSQIARVMQFFRTGHPDEISAVIYLLLKEGLISDGPKELRHRRRRRLNETDVNSSANSQPDRAEGVGA